MPVFKTIEIEMPMAVNVSVGQETLSVGFSDGRTLSVPVSWYPRLAHGSPEERNNWSLIGSGVGIHWEDLDEDISTLGLMEGKPSNEGQESFQQWLAAGKRSERVREVYRYEIILFWSKEDHAFVADVPELPGCMAHVDTYEASLANAREAIDLWIETAREIGDTVPEPHGRLFYA